MLVENNEITLKIFVFDNTALRRLTYRTSAATKQKTKN